MIASLALIALQTQILGFDAPVDDETPSASAFNADGGSLFVGHISGSMTRVDLAARRVALSVDIGGSISDVALAPSGQRLVVVAGDLGTPCEVHVLSSPGLAPVATVPLSVTDATELLVDGAGLRALVAGQGPAGPGVSVVNLSVGVEERVVGLPPLSTLSLAGVHRFLAADDRTLVVLAGDAVSGFEVRAIDISTGSTTATRVLPSGLAGVTLAPGGDRTTFAALVPDAQPAGTDFLLMDAVTLAPLSTTRLNGVFGIQQVELDGQGQRATALRGELLRAFDLTGGVVGPSDPGVVSIGRLSTGFVYSADRSRLLLTGDGGAIADSSGAILADLDVPVASGSGVAVSPSGARFGLTSSSAGDRVLLVDASGPSPAGTILDLNSGFGRETDGPVASLPIPGCDEGLVALSGSDTLLRVDLLDGAVLGRLGTERGPMALAARADGRFLVGHRDGTLAVVDASGPVQTGGFQLSGPVIEVVAEEIGTRALCRVEGPAGDELVLVETGGAAAGVLVSVPLSGRSRSGAYPAGDSFALDPASGRVAAVSLDPAELQRIDPASGVVLDTIPLTWAQGRLRVAIAPGGDRIICTASGPVPTIASYDVVGTDLQLQWSFTAGSAPVPGGQAGALALLADGDVAVVDLSGGASAGGPAGLTAFDASTGAVLDEIPSTFATDLAADGDDLALARGAVISVTRFVAGAFDALEDHALAGNVATAPLHLDRGRGRVLASARSDPQDGSRAALVTLDLFATRVDVVCTPSTPNATGVTAELALFGSPFAGGTTIATARGLTPGGMTGVLVAGSAARPPTPLPFGVGELCIGGSVGRVSVPPQVSDADGTQRYTFDTAPLTTSAGAFPVQPGDTWVFQLWHRDSGPGGVPSANTSEAVRLRFR